jgi:hypothetical protein
MDINFAKNAEILSSMINLANAAKTDPERAMKMVVENEKMYSWIKDNTMEDMKKCVREKESKKE